MAESIRIQLENLPAAQRFEALTAAARQLRTELESLATHTQAFAEKAEALAEVNAGLTELQATVAAGNEALAAAQATDTDQADQRRTARAEELEAEKEFYAERLETVRAYNEELATQTLETTATQMQALDELGAKQAQQFELETALNEARLATTETALGAFAAIGGALVNSQKDFGAAQKALFVFEKALAIRQVILNVQKEIGVINATYAAVPPLAAALTQRAIIGGTIRVATIVAQSVPKLARGGVLSGPSHARGGIQLVDSATGAITAEAEGGEVLLTAGVRQNPVLFRLASQLNQLAGGVRLEGLTATPARMQSGGVVFAPEPGRELLVAEALTATAERLANRPSVVSVAEINTVNQRVSVLEAAAEV